MQQVFPTPGTCGPWGLCWTPAFPCASHLRRQLELLVASWLSPLSSFPWPPTRRPGTWGAFLLLSAHLNKLRSNWVKRLHPAYLSYSAVIWPHGNHLHSSNQGTAHVSWSWSQGWSRCSDSHRNATSMEEVTFRNQFILLLQSGGQETHTSSLLGEVVLPNAAVPAPTSSPASPKLHPILAGPTHKSHPPYFPAHEHQWLLMQLENKHGLEDLHAPTRGNGVEKEKHILI